MPRASLVRASTGRAELERISLPSFVSENALRVVGRGQLIPGSSFTGPADRTYFDSDGILQTVAENEARTTYIGGNPYLGIDGAVEEISGRSHDVENWNFNSASISKNAIGLDGNSNSAFTITDSSNSSAHSAQNKTTISSGTDTYYVVVAFKKDTNPLVYPVAATILAGGTAVQQQIVVDPSDGTYVGRTGLTDGAVVLDPVLIGDFWLLVLSLTDNASGNSEVRQTFIPAYNTDGTSTIEESAQGSHILAYMGLFKDNFSLLPILTTGGTTKSLAAEVASLTNSIISSLTEGTIYMEIWSPQLTSNAARHIAELESDANNFIRVLHAADGDLDAQITDGGASQAALAGTDLTVGTLQKVALTFKANEFSLYRGGTQLATDTAGTVPSFDTLLIGAGLYGGIKTMNVHTTAWSQAKAESETT